MISRYHRSELDVCLLFKALPLCLFVLLGLLKMFDIPIGARHIVIEENETSPHIIGECLLLSHRVFVFFHTYGKTQDHKRCWVTECVCGFISKTQ